MSCRLLIPKNGWIYFLYFLGASGLLIGMLYYYYVPPELGGSVTEDSLAFLDLTRSTSLFQWFISILWLGMAVISSLLVFFSGSRRGGGLKSVFWMSIGAAAFLMSADAICGFIPVLWAIVKEQITEISGDEATVSMTLWILGIISLVFVLTESCFLWRYIRSFPILTRLTLKALFFAACLTLGFSVVFHYAIPSGGQTAPRRSMTARKSPPPPAPMKKSDAPLKNDGEKSGEAPNDETPSGEEDDAFRYVAFEKESDDGLSKGSAEKSPEESADEPPEDLAENSTEGGAEISAAAALGNEAEDESETISAKEAPASGRIEIWEDLFGWDKTLEENLGFKTTFEEMFGRDGVYEAELLNELKLDTLKTRELFRRGIYGFFLVFFSTGLGVLARAERIVFDKQLIRGHYQLLNHSELDPISDL